METKHRYAIIPALAVVVMLSTVVFVSCEKCEPEMQYTVAISGQTGCVDMHGPLWSTFSPTDVYDGVMDSLRRQFGDNLLLVTTTANVHIFIDSIITDSYEWDETKSDPCYGDHGWLYQMVNPPDQTTFRLHKTDVTIVYTVVDSVHMKTGWGRASGSASEYAYQPTGDSTQCFQYELAGNYDHHNAMVYAARQAYINFKCEIKKMMEP